MGSTGRNIGRTHSIAPGKATASAESDETMYATSASSMPTSNTTYVPPTMASIT